MVKNTFTSPSYAEEIDFQTAIKRYKELELQIHNKETGSNVRFYRV
jgi:hypothetical protein